MNVDELKEPARGTSTPTLAQNHGKLDAASKSALLARFYSALKELPHEDQAGYLDALDCAPQMVVKEADPLSFLACEKYDVTAAVTRFAKYWKRRKTLFGDRAFLPMSQTGDGCLAPDDLELLNTGFLSLLPRDEKGRVVLLFESLHLPKSKLSLERRGRCAFYMCSVISELSQDSDYDCSAVRVINTLENFHHNTRLELNVVDAIPFHFAEIANCCIPPPAARRYFKQTVAPAILGGLHEDMRKVTTVFVADSADHLMEQLRDTGAAFTRQCLPESAGGTWSYQSCPEWQRERIAFERKRDAWFNAETRIPASGKRKVDISEPQVVPSALVWNFAAACEQEETGRRHQGQPEAKTTKKPRSKKDRKWVKPEGKPKRPLSAYNLFFAEERQRIIKSHNDSEEYGDTGRKKVGFAGLARTIAARWKVIDAKTMAPLKQQAALEQIRYKRELGEWEELPVQEKNGTVKGSKAKTLVVPPVSNAGSSTSANSMTVLAPSFDYGQQGVSLGLSLNDGMPSQGSITGDDGLVPTRTPSVNSQNAGCGLDSVGGTGWLDRYGPLGFNPGPAMAENLTDADSSLMITNRLNPSNRNAESGVPPVTWAVGGVTGGPPAQGSYFPYQAVQTGERQMDTAAVDCSDDMFMPYNNGSAVLSLRYLSELLGRDVREEVIGFTRPGQRDDRGRGSGDSHSNPDI